MNLFDFLLNLWYNLDPDSYLRIAVPSVVSGLIVTAFSGRKKRMKYEVGDYVRINEDITTTKTIHGHEDVMDKMKGKTGQVVDLTLSGGIAVKSPIAPRKCRGHGGWIYSVKDVTPSTKEQYEKDCGIMQPEKIEWIKFVNGVPELKDAPRLEISEDGLSWRLKPLETKTEVETVSAEDKTETPDTKEETMGETKTTETTKLNFTPITDTSGLEDGEHYLVLDDDAILYATSYVEDDDNVPSDNFEGISSVAFYLNVNDLKPLLNIPSEKECQKVLEEESSVKEITEESSLEDIAENWDEYSEETKLGLVKFLKEKGIIS